MIEAIAIDVEGNYIGSYKYFTEQQWDSMKETFGKNLRWKLIENIEENPEISKEESEKIFGKKEPEIDMDTFKGLEEYTKRELIEKYGLSEDSMKLTKSQIINKIK